MGKVKNEVIRELETEPTCGGCGAAVMFRGVDCGACLVAEIEAAALENADATAPATKVKGDKNGL